MKELLKTNELRRFNLVEELVAANTWVTTSNLSRIIKSSQRVVKNDIAFLRDNYQFLIIESSYQWIRLTFSQETNLKDFYREILNESVSFNALELIFFNYRMTSDNLSERLFISESTLYRLTRDIDTSLKQHFGLCLTSNSYELVGDEQRIRYLYYLFFSEKYSNTAWPFHNIDEKALDELLIFFIEFSNVNMNYAYYRNFKIVTAVNLSRIQQNNLIKFDEKDSNLSEIVTDSDKLFSILQPTFQKLNLDLTLDNILQIFNNYVRKDFALNYERLMINTKKDTKLLKSVHYIDQFLDHTAEKFNLDIPNKEELIWHISYAAHNEGFEPHSGYILYNRNRMTIENFQSNFPLFFEHIEQGIQAYRQMIDKPLTKFSINHLIFQMFICWDTLLPQLQVKWKKIKVLLISDVNNGHGNLIKDQIDYYFNHKILIEIYDTKFLTVETIEATQCDMVISTFSIPILEDIPVICLNNIPSSKDIKIIEKVLDELIAAKNQTILN